VGIWGDEEKDHFTKKIFKYYNNKIIKKEDFLEE
jgi:hypothetical protein